MANCRRHRWIDIKPVHTWYRVCDKCWKQETLKEKPKTKKELAQLAKEAE